MLKLQREDAAAERAARREGHLAQVAIGSRLVVAALGAKTRVAEAQKEAARVQVRLACLCDLSVYSCIYLSVAPLHWLCRALVAPAARPSRAHGMCYISQVVAPRH